MHFWVFYIFLLKRRDLVLDKLFLHDGNVIFVCDQSQETDTTLPIYLKLLQETGKPVKEIWHVVFGKWSRITIILKVRNVERSKVGARCFTIIVNINAVGVNLSLLRFLTIWIERVYCPWFRTLAQASSRCR